MDDLISRRAAIKALDGEFEVTGEENAIAVVNYLNAVRERIKCLPADKVMRGIFLVDQRIKNLPSVDVPDRKVGKWLEREVIHAKEAKEVITEWQSCKCSVCGCYDTRPYLYCFNEPRFCSWCGADMRGEADVKV